MVFYIIRWKLVLEAYIVNDIGNFVFDLAKAFVYDFCKSRKLKFVMSFTIIIKTLYEVAYLADRLGGPNAKGIVATTYPVSGDKNLSEGIFKRLKKMNIGFIETASFKNHTASQVFNTAVQEAE